jgi:hypothetical protein
MQMWDKHTSHIQNDKLGDKYLSFKEINTCSELQIRYMSAQWLAGYVTGHWLAYVWCKDMAGSVVAIHILFYTAQRIPLFKKSVNF